MDTFTLVRTEHLNHHGKLFGGQLLKWVDEYAWLAASKDFYGTVFVTRAMDNSEFKYPVPNGTILRFHIDRISAGNTSVVYSVDVFADMPGAREELVIFSNRVTFVSVDEKGQKKAIRKEAE
jgi:acyl-CoA hydrolase